jgi:hypothetical protein
MHSIARSMTTSNVFPSVKREDHVELLHFAAPFSSGGNVRSAHACATVSNVSAHLANQSGQLILRRDVKFNGVKVFSATMVADRDQLGEKVTAWINQHADKKVTDLVVTQSSDEAFHCIAITVFYYEELKR